MKNDRLLESKTSIPRILPHYVNRGVLLGQLKEFEGGMEKAIVLNAGAGFGKTVLLSFYAMEEWKNQSAWYSLDALDNDLATFVEYLAQSIQKVFPQFQFNLSQDLIRHSLPVISVAYDFAIRLMNMPVDHLFIILDDFQEIDSEEVMTFLGELLDKTGNKIKFLFATKASFPNFLLRYFYNGNVKLIGSQDLSFSKDEIEILINQCPNVKEADQCASMLEEYTEGWPAGVMSVWLRIKQSRNDIGVYELGQLCGDFPANDYLMYEVYRKLPYDIQSFMSNTSILKVLSADMVNAVLEINNAKATLDYLVKENLFVIKLSGSEDIYQYHSLFQSYLRQQLTPQQRADICRKAALSSLVKGMNEQAVEYAMESGEFELVQLALERIGLQMAIRQKMTTLLYWLEYLEQHQKEWNVSTTLLASGIYLYHGDTPRSKELISLAEEKARIHNDKAEQIQVLLARIDYYIASGEIREIGEVADQALRLVTKPYSVNWYRIMYAKVEAALLILQEQKAAESARDILNAPLLHLGEAQHREVSCYRRRVSLLLEKKTFSYEIMGEKQPADGEENQGRDLGKVLAGFFAWKRIYGYYQNEMPARMQQEAAGFLEQMGRNHTYTVYIKYLIACLRIREQKYDLAAPYLEQARGYCELNQLPLPELKPEDAEGILKYDDKKAGKPEERRLMVNCFGEFQVKIGETDVSIPWRTKKARELFAFLYDRQGMEVSKDVITEALWPEVDRDSVSTLFYTTVSYVRKALTNVNYPNVILQKNRMYSMDMAWILSPLKSLEEMASGQNEEGKLVTELYHGAYLGSIQGNWIIEKREYYERLFMQLCRSQAKMLMQKKRYEDAIAVLSDAVAIDGYAEELAAMLIQCYGKVGDIKNAKRQFERTQKLLQEELGVEAGEELVLAYQNARKQKQRRLAKDKSTDLIKNDKN